MDFIAKRISNIINAAEQCSISIAKFILSSATTATEDKFKTMVDTLKIPKAQLILCLLVSQILHAKSCSMLHLNSSYGNIDSGGKEGDHENDRNVAPTNLAGLLRVHCGRFRRKSLASASWIPAYCAKFITASVCFEVVFHYKIERMNCRDRNYGRSGKFDPVNFVVKLGECIRNELKN